MIMPPLFPENNGPILIQQGNTGDCYLLAALECFFNGSPEGFALIHRLFRKVDGGVEVRFAHNEYSHHLKIEQMRGKYGYRYDRLNNQDVIYISDYRLQEIDSAEEGVITNCLAVKIMERLIPYYFNHPWEAERPVRPNRRMIRSDSVNAHNLDKRFDDSSTGFLAKLWNVRTHENIHIHSMIHLKSIFPDQPIYMSIRHGEPDERGVISTRHAFKIEQLQQDRNKFGQYQFILINPSNNSIHQRYSQEHIEQHNPIFSIFETDQIVFKWIHLLLQTPDLLKKMSHLKQLNPRFQPHRSIDILSNDILMLHAIIRERLTIEANAWIENTIQKIQGFSIDFPASYLISAIEQAGELLKQTLHQVAFQDPRLEIALNTLGLPASQVPERLLQSYQDKRTQIEAAIEQRKRIANRVNEKIILCVHQLNSFEVVFNLDGSKRSIHQQKDDLFIRMNLLLNDSELQRDLEQIGLQVEGMRVISEAKRNKTQEIHRQFEYALERIQLCQRSEAILKRIDFLSHLSSIDEKIRILERGTSSHMPQPRFLSMAQELHRTLNQAQNHFIYSTSTWDVKVREFKSTCLTAIHQATQSLNVDDDWRQILPPLRTNISNIRDVSIRGRNHGSMSFFSHANPPRRCPMLMPQPTSFAL